jgi:hypothetical protein
MFADSASLFRHAACRFDKIFDASEADFLAQRFNLISLRQ